MSPWRLGAIARIICYKACSRWHMSFERFAALTVMANGGMIVSLSVLPHLDMFKEMGPDKIFTGVTFGCVFLVMGAAAFVAFRPSRQ